MNQDKVEAQIGATHGLIDSLTAEVATLREERGAKLAGGEPSATIDKQIRSLRDEIERQEDKLVGLGPLREREIASDLRASFETAVAEAATATKKFESAKARLEAAQSEITAARTHFNQCHDEYQNADLRRMAYDDACIKHRSAHPESYDEVSQCNSK